MTTQEKLQAAEDAKRKLDQEIWELKKLAIKEKIADKEVGVIYEDRMIDNLYHIHVDEGSEGFDYLIQTESKERAELIVHKILQDNIVEYNLEDGYTLTTNDIGRYGVNFLIDSDYQEGLNEEADILITSDKKEAIRTRMLGNLVQVFRENKSTDL